MEDVSQGLGSRRSRPSPRPESSASSHARMSAQTPSSNSSSLNLPPKPPTSRTVSGASLLQERLRERKFSDSGRQSRRQSIDMSGVALSSPSRLGAREERRPSSSGPNNKGMGVKQIEEHVSTLTKQNFNLKLELHHRRERQTTLEERLEAAERQIEEQRELQEVNEQLLAELEKRDMAVEEAVGIIVTLEDKIKELMREREVVDNFDDRYESGYFHSNHDEQLNSQSTFDEKKNNTSQAMMRMPSFLSEKSEGAEALRSLYLPSNHSYKNSDATLPKLAEDGYDGMNSPRLSALSESSFASIYGDKTLSLDNNEEVDEGVSQRRHRKSSSVEKWIDERPVSTNPIAARNDIRKNQYLSINDVMESPLQRLEKLRFTLEKHNPNTISSKLVKRPSIKAPRKSRDTLRRVLTDKTSFEHQQGLPPTPDTISTSTLRHFQANSNDTLAQDAREPGFLHGSSIIPSNEHYNIHQSTKLVRPHSAGETITSRREGHGWDTETQGDDFSSNASTFSAQNHNQPTRIMTPNLFSFADFRSDDRDGGWGSEFKHSTPGNRAHTAMRYASLRSNSMADHSRDGDNTPRAARYSDSQFGTSPIDTSPRPEPPNRRSSLTATKLRKAREIKTSASLNQSTFTSSPTPKQETKKNRLTSRLFGRSETAPSTVDTAVSQQPLQKHKQNSSKTQSYFDNSYEDEVARATPPPIKRSRDINPPRYRPSSAGTVTSTGPNTLRRTSAFGGDGTGETLDAILNPKRRGSVGAAPPASEEDTTATGKNTGGRKWLASFGRTSSMRNK